MFTVNGPEQDEGHSFNRRWWKFFLFFIFRLIKFVLQVKCDFDTKDRIHRVSVFSLFQLSVWQYGHASVLIDTAEQAACTPSVASASSLSFSDSNSLTMTYIIKAWHCFPVKRVSGAVFAS